MDFGGTLNDGGVNPRKDANLLSIITFFYNFKILFQGRKQDLQEEDLYKVLPEFEASKLGDKLELQWQENATSEEKSSLLMCCIKCFGLIYLVYTILQLAFSTTMIFLQPMVFSKFVAYFETGQTVLTRRDAYVYASAVVGLDFVSKIYNQNFSQLVTEYSVAVRTAVCSLIFRKSLRVDPEAFSTITAGKIVTFISKDIYCIDGEFMFLKDMVIGYVHLGVVTYLLYRKLGAVAFLAIGVLLVIIFIQVISGVSVKKNRLKTVIQSDKRYKILQEALNSIKIIRMHLWQDYFETLIEKVRMEEIAKLRLVYFLKAFVIALGGSAISLSFYSIFVAKAQSLDAETVYYVQQCLSALSNAISTSIPFGITQTADTIASLQRIQAFLEAKELKPKPKNHDKTPKIIFKNAKISLLNITCLTIIDNGLVVVTGPVGSGKSTLLQSILSENRPSSGLIDVKGTISYAPQEPWLFPSTIRQNILFGQPYHKKRYQDVLRACALTYDIGKLEELDQTIVSDKGMNLSKGQQARISLARAIYKDSDIYLLDDCLSSLDNRVSNYVFKKCIEEFLQNKLRVLVTNNSSYIRAADKVIFIEDGDCVVKCNGSKEDVNLEEMDAHNEESRVLARVRGSEIDLLPRINLYHEDNKEGKVLWSTYASYYRYLGGWVVCLLLLLIFLAAQFCTSYGDKVISLWVNVESDLNDMNYNKSETNTTRYEKAIREGRRYLEIYTVLMAAGLLLFVCKGLYAFHYCLKAARRLHDAAVKATLHCRMTFFDNHFIGNVINRLSKDFYTIDEYIPFLVYDCSRSLFSSVGVAVLLATVSWGFVVLIILLFVALFFLMRLYLPTGRSLRRLEAATRTPVIGYFNSTLEGLPVVRASAQQIKLQLEFDRHQDLYTSAYYTNQTTARLFAFLIDMLGTFFIFGITFKFIVLPEDNNAGDVGLAISQAMSLSSVLQWVFKQLAEIETVMTSIERVQEYAGAQAEPSTGRELTHWPVKGSIEFRNVSLIYNNHEVLSELNFKITPGEKIAIVGRTGAGKSSIISTLFRLHNFEGSIFIDQENINDLTLHCLRSSLSIIPQDPILFSGSVRTNIDPLEEFRDQDLWDALEKAHAADLVDDLNAPTNSSFSSGEKQLICLARAIVRKSKIIIVDEISASLDARMDALVQETVRQCFKGCTLLMVAHRLEFVERCDRVMVIHDGRMVEFDKPGVLLEKKGGLLNTLILGEDNLKAIQC